MNSKQILDMQQMQHLQEMGLDTSNASALYCIDNETGEKQLMLNEQVEETDKDDEYFRIVPAYTLQDVLDALPIEIKYKDKRCWLCIELADEMIGYYYENDRFEHRWVYYEVVMIDESLIDAAYRLLIWVIENGYISKLPANKNSK